MRTHNQKINQQREPILEPFFRSLRFHVSLKDIPSNIDTCVDLGCGPSFPFFHYLKQIGKRVNQYIGIDPLLGTETSKTHNTDEYLTLNKKPLHDLSEIQDKTVDLVVAFAFLEHVDNPGLILNDVIRILKPGGLGLFTTPSFIAKPVLEFLSFRLHIVSEREIAEHKQYFDKKSLMQLFSIESLASIELSHSYFEMGFNNYLRITKKM